MPSIYVSTQTASNIIASGSNITAFNNTSVTIAWWMKEATGGNGSAGFGGGIFLHADTANLARNGYDVSYVGQPGGGINAIRFRAKRTNGEAVNQLNFPVRKSAGMWTHYCVTFDATNATATLYVDGFRVTSVVSGGSITTTTTCTTQIGPNVEITALRGWLFDLQVFDRAVRATDIPLLMKPNHREPGLVARYCGLGCTVNSASGTLFDETLQGRNLTTVNPASTGLLLAEEPPFRPTMA